MNLKQANLIPAIILSAHNIGLGVMRSLGKYGIPITAVSYQKQDMGHVSKYVNDKISAPHPEKYEKQFIDLLIDLASRFGKCILIPADDATLVAVSKNKEQLTKHHIAACAEWKIIKKVIDKKYTYELAESLGIAAPKTIVPQSFSEANEYAKNITYPCLVKPRQSHRYFEIFRRKMLKVQSRSELIAAYNEASDAGMEVMLQEYIPGDEPAGVNYNSYFWNNTAIAEFTSEKLRMSPPEFGVPGLVVSKHIPEILSPGRQILEALGYSGYSCTEFKKDPRDGKYKLLEINGRYNRSLLLSLKCGINFPLIEYRHKILGEYPATFDYKDGIYWIDAAKDLSACMEYRKKPQFSMIKYIKPYVKPNIFAVFDVRDPMPFIKRCIDILGMIFQAIFKSRKVEIQSRKITQEQSI